MKNEIIHYLNILSSDLNKLHVYHTKALTNPYRVRINKPSHSLFIEGCGGHFSPMLDFLV
ncbi:MAG: hypothetical protein Q4A24_07580 [Akkermansia sp.]|nr:hypothetical protein [Akkermansia sp.]